MEFAYHPAYSILALAHKNGNIKLYRRLTLVDEIFAHHPLKNLVFNEEGTYMCCICRGSELLFYETDTSRRNYIDVGGRLLKQARFLSPTKVVGLCGGEKGVCVELFDLLQERKIASHKLPIRSKLEVLSPNLSFVVYSS